MTVDRLLQQADYFLKLSQQADQYDSEARNTLVNTAPSANGFSFRQIAGVVLTDLTAADREEKDPTVTAASHALLDILNSTTVPDVNNMLTAAQQAAQVIRKKYPADIDKQKVANYLVRVVQMLINKHSSTPGIEEPQAEEPSRESFSQFLNELYYKLRSNQPLDDNAVNKWHNTKDWYVRRLNGLKSSPSLTAQQQQEKYILNYVLNRVNV